jgi:hypothetical protein
MFYSFPLLSIRFLEQRILIMFYKLNFDVSLCSIIIIVCVYFICVEEKSWGGILVFMLFLKVK